MLNYDNEGLMSRSNMYRDVAALSHAAQSWIDYDGLGRLFMDFSHYTLPHACLTTHLRCCAYEILEKMKDLRLYSHILPSHSWDDSTGYSINELIDFTNGNIEHFLQPNKIHLVHNDVLPSYIEYMYVIIMINTLTILGSLRPTIFGKVVDWNLPAALPRLCK